MTRLENVIRKVQEDALLAQAVKVNKGRKPKAGDVIVQTVTGAEHKITSEELDNFSFSTELIYKPVLGRYVKNFMDHEVGQVFKMHISHITKGFFYYKN